MSVSSASSSSAAYQYYPSSISVNSDNTLPILNYSRVFQPRLLGFRGPIKDPSTVTSYCPCSGLSYAVWRLPDDESELFIDPSCILVTLAGHINPVDNTLSYGIFHGPGSPRNLSSYLPSQERERTRTKLHAELYATAAALKQLRELEETRPGTKNVVIITNSRRIMHGLSSCVITWKNNGWMRAQGRKPVANAKSWKKIVEHVEELEKKGVGVRFWCTDDESGIMDAARLAEQVASKSTCASTVISGSSKSKSPGTIMIPAPFQGYAPWGVVPGMVMSPTSSNYSTSTFSDAYGTDPTMWWSWPS